MIPKSHKLIRHAYKKSGMTYQEISDRYGCNRKTFERWMNGASSCTFDGTVDLMEVMGQDIFEVIEEVQQLNK